MDLRRRHLFRCAKPGQDLSGAGELLRSPDRDGQQWEYYTADPANLGGPGRKLTHADVDSHAHNNSHTSRANTIPDSYSYGSANSSPTDADHYPRSMRLPIPQ